MTVSLDLPVWIVYPYLFAIGAVIGSFLNVCIYRIPVHARFRDQLRSLWDRPSHCPRCRTNIRWHDNIPIFGWLKLRGRCRECKMRISPRYPLIELVNACLWVLVFHLEVPLGRSVPLSESCIYSEIGPQVHPGLGWLSPEWFVVSRFLYHMVLIEALLVASMIDFDLRIIPDGSTLPAMAVGVLASTVIGRTHLVPVWFQLPNLQQSFGIIMPEWVHPLLAGPEVPEWITAYPSLHGLAVSVAGIVVGGGIVWIVRLIGFWLLRQEAMGFGDVVLMALVGSFLGWQATIIAFFIAPLCAMIVVVATSLVKRERMIPYGPYLSLGALITLLAWQPAFAHSRRFFELGVLLLPMAGVMVILFIGSLVMVQGIKRLLGIRSLDTEEPGQWLPGDQNWFFSGELVDRHTCRWKTRDWDGCASAHGTIHEERWRDGNRSSLQPRFGQRPPDGTG